MGREGAIEGNAFLFRDIDVGGKEKTLGECFWEGERWALEGGRDNRGMLWEGRGQ